MTRYDRHLPFFFLILLLLLTRYAFFYDERVFNFFFFLFTNLITTHFMAWVQTHRFMCITFTCRRVQTVSSTECVVSYLLMSVSVAKIFHQIHQPSFINLYVNSAYGSIRYNSTQTSKPKRFFAVIIQTTCLLVNYALVLRKYGTVPLSLLTNQHQMLRVNQNK